MTCFIVCMLAATAMFVSAAFIAARYDEPVYVLASTIPVMFLILVAASAYADEKGIDLSDNCRCCYQCAEEVKP